jgi:putative membrane protein
LRPKLASIPALTLFTETSCLLSRRHPEEYGTAPERLCLKGSVPNWSDLMVRLPATTAVLAVGLLLAPASFAQTSQPTASPATKSTLSQEDLTFVKEAAISGTAEVELSKLAQKSDNAEVKSFADRMIRDHTAANQQLTTVATGLGADIPKALDAEHERLRENVQILHGKAFDEQYMQAMVEDHNKAVTLFEREGLVGQNADLKQFAQKTLPTLQEHQKMAGELSRKIAQAAAR